MTKPLVLAWDNGSFSGKVESDIARGSFLSMVAPITNDTMDSFSPLEFSGREGQNFDLSVYDQVNGDWTRWVVGERAEGMDGMQRTSRNMHRAQDGRLFQVFMCAALRTAFPKIIADKDQKLEDRAGKPHHSWAKPVAMVGSIAPDYFKQWKELDTAARGYYHFIDNSNGYLYSFNVMDLRVVPESFGGYAMRLYQLDKDTNRIVMEKGKAVARKGGASLQKLNVGCIDPGGRTLDITLWEATRLTRWKSLDVGIHQYIDAMIRDVMSAYPGNFGTQPTRMQIYRAMAKAMKKPGELPKGVVLKGLYGKPLDVTELVNRQMFIFTNRFFEAYQDVLMGGQEIDSLLWMGGGSNLLEPYILSAVSEHDKTRKTLHEREEWVSRDHDKVWMANAIGGYAWGKMIFDKVYGAGDE